jgi:hypothetical protein
MKLKDKPETELQHMERLLSATTQIVNYLLPYSLEQRRRILNAAMAMLPPKPEEPHESN